jgi:HK97 family phage major capsid protein
MTSTEKRDIERLKNRIRDIEDQARDHGRDLSDKERTLRDELLGAVHDVEMRQIEAPLTVEGSRRLSSPAGGTGGFADMGDFMNALYKKSRGEGYDPRLEPLQIRASISESGPASEGGFAIPTQFVERALNENLEDTVLLQLCDRQVMTTNSMTTPAFEDNNHSATAPFGITWGQIAENGSWGTLQGTPFRSMQLTAHKSGALFLVSNEWLADSSNAIRQRLENIWRASLRWYVEDLLWVGTGAGQCLGALTGGGALSVPAEVGQKKTTILAENVVNQWARLRPGSHSRAIWVCNASCFSQLAALSIAVGTGGVPVSLLSTNQGAGIAGAPATSMLGRPLYISEHLPTLGNAGDLVLLDPTLYLLGDRQQIVLDASPHVRFESDQTVFRASARLDGQPIYSDVLTPKNGPTAGWLVKIAARTV